MAVYGGSFNPPHIVHAWVSTWLLWTDQVDAVWLVPVYQHAFEDRHGKRLAPYTDRMAWCAEMAADVDARIQVSDVESTLPTPSFTIDTLRHFKASHPEHSFRLVVGSDVIPQLPDWRDWAGIEAEFSPIIVGRAGYDSPPGSVVFPGISSTEIRKKLRSGVDVGHLLTAGVREMIYSSGWPTK
ncbi:MAG: nicotinate-nicotinamide nucleotide adenylyltransferase [Myxococcota bacterium]|nr:nicotinate-nicotinamide nucleotide adenylyltransferase [Myxococcota bacterium]